MVELAGRIVVTDDPSITIDEIEQCTRLGLIENVVDVDGFRLGLTDLWGEHNEAFEETDRHGWFTELGLDWEDERNHLAYEEAVASMPVTNDPDFEGIFKIELNRAKGLV